MMIPFRSAIALSLIVLTSSLLVAASLNQDSLESEEQEVATRIREGTEVRGATGWFRRAGERIEFQSLGETTKLVVLENLALERVAAELEGEVSLVWQIDGTITEFHGRNYLLVERAFVKSTIER